MENNQQPLAPQQQADQLHPVSPTSPHSPSKAFVILIVVVLILTVSVGGYILGTKRNRVVQNQTQPVPPITQLSPTSISTPSVFPTTNLSITADWKTYRNEEFGFEVRYPENWFNITHEDIVGGNSFEFSNNKRSSGDLESVVVQVAFGGDIDLFNSLRNAKPGKTVEKNRIFYTKIRNEVVAGYPAVRYRGDYRNIPAGTLPTGEEVLVENKEKILHFKIWGSSSQIVQDNQDIFNQILSTFQFSN